MKEVFSTIMLNTKKIALKIINLLDDKKAEDIKLLNISKISSLADYFIICSGNSTIQIKAIADELEEKMETYGYKYLRKEGKANANWILYDYGEVIIHIFHHESRKFYNLERLWSDAQVVDISALKSKNELTEE